MSLHDRFDYADHPGFTRSVDPRSARRQLHVSLGVVSILALAIIGSVIAISPATGFDVNAQRASIAAAAALSHHDMNADLHRSGTIGG